LSIDLKKIKAIVNWRELKNITQLRLFLGFCNYCRRFIAQWLKDIKLFTTVTLCPGTIASVFGGFCRRFWRQSYLGIEELSETLSLTLAPYHSKTYILTLIDIA
ncbi:uncharacterized protein K441DRAFT_568552, partial [Cenococcum geophilum 1.58]|uniref:uncharacterized protein n=1 Tax=Cenococcum geophilum 1.58 TaxID=794803 RepID=UPI00358E2DAB